MQVGDIDAVHALGARTSALSASDDRGFWDKEELKVWIGENTDVLLVAKEGNDIVGFVLTSAHPPTKTATVEDIAVEKKSRGLGVGKQLLTECMECLRRSSITYLDASVQIDNDHARDFFSACDFEYGYDFVWMEKNL